MAGTETTESTPVIDQKNSLLPLKDEALKTAASALRIRALNAFLGVSIFADLPKKIGTGVFDGIPDSGFIADTLFIVSVTTDSINVVTPSFGREFVNRDDYSTLDSDFILSLRTGKTPKLTLTVKTPEDVQEYPDNSQAAFEKSGELLSMLEAYYDVAPEDIPLRNGTLRERADDLTRDMKHVLLEIDPELKNFFEGKGGIKSIIIDSSRNIDIQNHGYGDYTLLFYEQIPGDVLKTTIFLSNKPLGEKCSVAYDNRSNSYDTGYKPSNYEDTQNAIYAAARLIHSLKLTEASKANDAETY